MMTTEDAKSLRAVEGKVFQALNLSVRVWVWEMTSRGFCEARDGRVILTPVGKCEIGKRLTTRMRRSA